MKEEYYTLLLPNDFCVIGEKIVINTAGYSSFIEIDFQTGSFRYMNEISPIRIGEACLYSSIFNYNNKIICTPRYASKYLIYNQSTRDSKYVDFPDFRSIGGRLMRGVFVDHYIYSAPEKYSKVVVFDAEEERIVDEIAIGNGEIDNIGTPFELNNHVFFPCLKSGLIYELDIKHNSIKEHKVNNMIGCQGMTFWKDCFYIWDRNYELYACTKNFDSIGLINGISGEIYGVESGLWNIDYENNTMRHVGNSGVEEHKMGVNCIRIIASKFQQGELYVLTLLDDVVALLEFGRNNRIECLKSINLSLEFMKNVKTIPEKIDKGKLVSLDDYIRYIKEL